MSRVGACDLHSPPRAEQGSPAWTAQYLCPPRPALGITLPGNSSQSRPPFHEIKMSLVGSLRRVAANRKAVQSVYLRSAQKQASQGAKITSQSFIKSAPSVNLDFSKTSPVWKDIPRGYVPYM